MLYDIRKRLAVSDKILTCERRVVTQNKYKTHGEDMNHNKQSIQDTIEQLEDALAMEKHLREKLEQFKKYKQVNVKFINALTESGEFHAYISKDKYSTIFNMYKNNPKFGYEDRISFRLACSSNLCATPITWERIEEELQRYAFQERLDQAFQMMKYFEIEKVKFAELCRVVNEMEFKCFDLYNIKRELNQKLEYANHT